MFPRSLCDSTSSLDSYGMIGIEIYHKELTTMPRPKGSKNKKAFEQVESIETIDERIAAAETAVTAREK